MLRHKENLNKYKNNLCILSVHYEMKLKINSQQNSSKCINSLLNDEKFKEEIKIFLELNLKENTKRQIP